MKISNIEKELFIESFTTPEGYFDSFHDRIMNKVQTEPNAISASKLSFCIRYAAVLILIYLLCGSVYYHDVKTHSTYNYSPYTKELVDELIDSYIIDNYTFYDCITESN